jgi:hypothetical protein
MDEGIAVYGVDSSPTLCAAFRSNMPKAHVACESVEKSEFYGKRFEPRTTIKTSPNRRPA